MPQNTPMKRQFTTIDGRTVMSNLPQHWGGNDWKITGVDNPLPIGNYVQTEAGVWIPQKGSDNGAADVRVTGSYVENVIPRGIYRSLVTSDIRIPTPEWANRLIVEMRVYGITGTDVVIQLYTLLQGIVNVDMMTLSEKNITKPSRIFLVFGENSELGDLEPLSDRIIKSTPFKPTLTTRTYVNVNGIMGDGEGADLEVNYIWQT